MKIKMRSTAASPHGAYRAGKTYSVPDEVGRPFVEGGYAELIEGSVKLRPARETATIEPEETADDPGAGEDENDDSEDGESEEKAKPAAKSPNAGKRPQGGKK